MTLEELKSEIEAQEIIAELKYKLAEYNKFGLDKELQRLKKTEGFGNENTYK